MRTLVGRCDEKGRNKHCDAVFAVSEPFAKAVPNRLEAFAVSTPCIKLRLILSFRLSLILPCGVKLDENILAIVEDDFLEVLAHYNVNGFVLRFGNWFTLERGLNLALKV